MRANLHRLIESYPRQFWLLFVGMLISTTGASMIWPFLMIYVSEQIHLSVGSATSLYTINAAFGLVFAFIAGPITDFAGRKWVMVISLIVNGAVYLFMSSADSYADFAILMGLSGAFNPLYRVGADAMMADLISPERRPDAYSLLRMSNNVGVAMGPAIGGFVATISYATAFSLAATGMIAYGLLIVFFARETLAQRVKPFTLHGEFLAGYRHILSDRPFISFVSAYTLTQFVAAIMWVLLALYAKTQYQISERQYGFIPTVNALMVILFQFSVTQWTKKRPALLMLALGSLFYAVGVGSVALGNNFWWFLGSMVIMTVGELIVTPVATTMAANLAPADMRGRYMSIYGLTWGVAAGVGPRLGGFLNDTLSPVATWYGAFVIGMVSTLAFLGLHRQIPGQVDKPGWQEADLK